MTRPQAKLAVTTSLLLVIGCVLLFLALRFSLRHHVEHLIGANTVDLPQPTVLLAPIIGGEFAPGLPGALGTAVWLLLLLAPIPLAWWALKAPSPSDIVIRWGVGLAVYMPLVLLLALLTAFGLWLPFQYL
jgi:hypothetical protein